MEYYIIISASVIIILSYLFNRIADKSNIPSVLLLIILGLISKYVLQWIGIDESQIIEVITQIKLLELLGTSGLILIVLEAALELKIQKQKLLLILKASLVAFMGFFVCLFSVAFILYFAYYMNWLDAVIYATPISIISSAIVIPSVSNLDDESEEFHIYESTLSDIIGIMTFYFFLSLGNSSNNISALGGFVINFFLTIITSVFLSYLLIYIFQNLETKVKLFLMISILFLLFSIGKLLHLSSLIIILVFGLILNNNKLFFPGILKTRLKPVIIKNIYESFFLITTESAFVIRTFFFFIFGFSISVFSILDIKVAIISLIILVFIYLSRAISFVSIGQKKIKNVVFLAPRGLITLLLFYSIPKDHVDPNFDSGILLFVIITTSLIMTYGLVKNTKKIQKSSK